MSTLAIGDIHGNSAALADLLHQLLPELMPEDCIVFLGDYIDGGPDSKGCIDQIIRFRDAAPGTVVALTGNHEDWLLRTYRDYTRHSWVLGMEAFDTIRSYSPEAETLLRAELERAGTRIERSKQTTGGIQMKRPDRDQFAGCLIGQCLGDAAGFLVEGQPPDV